MAQLRAGRLRLDNASFGSDACKACGLGVLRMRRASNTTDTAFCEHVSKQDELGLVNLG